MAFSRDWQADAERRDLTINALYASADGEVMDLVGGLADLERRNIRFIGDAATRIAEDHLRILRFFRFFAYYGKNRDWEMVDVVQFKLHNTQQVADLGGGLEIENGAFILKERAPGVSVEEIVSKTAGKLIVPEHVPQMQFARTAP